MLTARSRAWLINVLILLAARGHLATMKTKRHAQVSTLCYFVVMHMSCSLQPFGSRQEAFG